MAKDAINDYDPTTATNNSDIGGNNIAENNLPGTLNNALRQLCLQLVRAVANKGSDLTAASTVNIAAAGTSLLAAMTGTTTITSFGTPNGYPFRIIRWDAATPVTYNATSMKLLGAASRTMTVGAYSMFIHEGSGNWAELFYSAGLPLTGTGAQSISGTAAGALLTLTSTEAGATSGPDAVLDRNSASPLAGDNLARIRFNGRDSGGNATTYADIQGYIVDPTDGSEDGTLYFGSLAAGTISYWAYQSGSLLHVSATGGAKGAGTVNSTGLYVNGAGVAGPKYIIADQKAANTNGGAISNGSFVKRTLNTEIVDEIGITTTTSTMSVPAGTYRAKFVTTCFAVDNFQARLRDTTNNVDLVLGCNADAPSGVNGQSTGYGHFTLSGTANVELQVRVTTTNGTDGGGQATNFGTETYSIVELEKVA